MPGPFYRLMDAHGTIATYPLCLFFEACCRDIFRNGPEGIEVEDFWV